MRYEIRLDLDVMLIWYYYSIVYHLGRSDSLYWPDSINPWWLAGTPNSLTGPIAVQKQAANHKAKMEPDEMKEGFLCPICKTDLRSAELLMQHVDTVHNKKTKKNALPAFNESYYIDDSFYKQDIGQSFVFISCFEVGLVPSIPILIFFKLLAISASTLMSALLLLWIFGKASSDFNIQCVLVSLWLRICVYEWKQTLAIRLLVLMINGHHHLLSHDVWLLS